MTQESAAQVKLTADNLAEARAAARREEEVVLARIAEELPDRLDAVAKKYAHRQPDVTQSLGRENLDAMRAELAAEAEAIGDRFIAAIDDIDWPTTMGIRGSQAVHSALFKVFFRKLPGPARVLENYGFKVRETGYRDSLGEVITPQELYDQDAFRDLAKLLEELGVAEREHEKAVKAHERAAVEDLWG